jgi:hypothetical protein
MKAIGNEDHVGHGPVLAGGPVVVVPVQELFQTEEHSESDQDPDVNGEAIPRSVHRGRDHVEQSAP